jgi:chain length determinant protein tyrosine kinase EpsG
LGQGDVIPAPASGQHTGNGASTSIGAILVDTGRLKAGDIETVLRYQRASGLLFGDAAVKLELVTAADVEFALSRQFDYPYLLRGQSAVSEDVVAAYDPFTPQVETLRALRSQIMLRWFSTDPDHKMLAIVSSERGEGRSFIAANLAVVFSQLGERTLLIDADLRNPCQHRLFGLANRHGLTTILSGRAGTELIQRIPGLVHLSVLPAGALPPNPSELLARPVFRQMLQEVAKQYDVILLDTSSASATPDPLNVSMCAEAALIVVRKNAARVWQVRGIADDAAQSSATLVGTVLNDF